MITNENDDKNTRDVISPPAHLYIAIFELVHPFDHGMMLWKCRDDISNGSGVIVLTDSQTDAETDRQTNNANGHYWKQCHPRFACENDDDNDDDDDDDDEN